MSTFSMQETSAPRTGTLVPTVGRIKGEMESYKPWQPPKGSEAGKSFLPKRHAAGDVVVFESGGKRMMGPVWSEGPNRGELWVVVDQQAYLVRGAK